jgi:hypothetical protein
MRTRTCTSEEWRCATAQTPEAAAKAPLAYKSVVRVV